MLFKILTFVFLFLQVAMDSQSKGDYTCLTFMTPECLLAELVPRKSLREFTHIIIDDVHERDQETDLLLMIVRMFLHKTHCNAKVILMSATAHDCDVAWYFRNSSSVPAPVVKIDCRESQKVHVYYLDDFTALSVRLILKY